MYIYLTYQCIFSWKSEVQMLSSCMCLVATILYSKCGFSCLGCSVILHSRFVFLFICANYILMIYTFIPDALNSDKVCCSDINEYIILVKYFLIHKGWRDCCVSMRIWVWICSTCLSWAWHCYLSLTTVLGGVVRKRQGHSWSSLVSQSGWIIKFVSQRNVIIGFLCRVRVFIISNVLLYRGIFQTP